MLFRANSSIFEIHHWFWVFFRWTICGLFLTNFYQALRSSSQTLWCAVKLLWNFLLNKLYFRVSSHLPPAPRLPEEWAGRRSASNATYVLGLWSSLKTWALHCLPDKRWQCSYTKVNFVLTLVFTLLASLTNRSILKNINSVMLIVVIIIC